MFLWLSPQVLVDCTPETTSYFGNYGFDDAGCVVGTIKRIDVGTANLNKEIDVEVESIDQDGNMVISLTKEWVWTCTDYEVTMKASDLLGGAYPTSFDNVLHLGENSVELTGDTTETTTVCLPGGTYSPYACGGSYGQYVEISIAGPGGVALTVNVGDDDCTPTAGSFDVPYTPDGTSFASTSTIRPPLYSVSAFSFVRPSVTL